MHELNRIVEGLNADPQFLARVAILDRKVLVLSATDTGRSLTIAIGEAGVSIRPHAGEPFDARIEATEEVHWAVLSGQMDADAAFFSGKVRIYGSLVTAFRMKNRFLSLLQSYLAQECAPANKPSVDCS
jgi:putative sterol carrier protein